MKANVAADTRFFIVKSFNEENVRQCMDDVGVPWLPRVRAVLTFRAGVWATQSQNADMLGRAFAQCKNVLLFFSINKSKAFQGYVCDAAPVSFPSRPLEHAD